MKDIYSLTRVYLFKSTLLTMFYLFDLKKNMWVYNRMTYLVIKFKFSLRLNNSK